MNTPIPSPDPRTGDEFDAAYACACGHPWRPDGPEKEPVVTDEDTTLTEAEQDVLRHTWPMDSMVAPGRMFAAVERILAQRKAADHATIEAVRALADSWDAKLEREFRVHGFTDWHSRALRDALGDDVQATNRAGL